METIYNVDYFIKKFQAIPENKWAIGTQHDGAGKSCALGHCDAGNMYGGGQYTAEGAALINLFISNGLTVGECTAFANRLDKKGPYHAVASVNNGSLIEYQEATPKQRILAALYDIYEKTYGRKYGEQEQTKEKVIYKTVVIDSKVKKLQEALNEN